MASVGPLPGSHCGTVAVFVTALQWVCVRGLNEMTDSDQIFDLYQTTLWYKLLM